MLIVRLPSAKPPPAASRRIALPSTAASLNVASPTSNVCPTPTTWRLPFVQIAAAVGAAGVATASSPAAELLGAEPGEATVRDVECDAGCDADALAGADEDEDVD